MKNVLIVLTVMLSAAPAFAGPADWCMSKIGYAPETALMETASKLEVAKTEVRMLTVFNEKLQSMITGANVAALVSFGIACLLAGVFVEGIKRWLKTAWNKVYRQSKPAAAPAEFP